MEVFFNRPVTLSGVVTGEVVSEVVFRFCNDTGRDAAEMKGTKKEASDTVKSIVDSFRIYKHRCSKKVQRNDVHVV